MLTNNPIVEFDKIATIYPLLVNEENTNIPWEEATITLQAVCIWSDLENAGPYGEFTVFPNGKLEFKPLYPGTFTIKCLVSYVLEGNSNIIDGALIFTVPSNITLPVEIKYITLNVKVSTMENNRLVKDNSGALYVPEVTVDLLNVYIQSKQ